jgi:hypothetical protein
MVGCARSMRPRSSAPLTIAAIVTIVMTAVALAGCTGHAVPDPKSAADDYAAAASRGDADAIYEMMTTSAQKSRSRDDVRRLVKEQRGELSEQAKLVTARDARVEATARLRYEDGEEAQLELRDGRFWITSSGALPGGSRTPEQALDQLRRVLARRSYAGLMRVLTPSTRAAIEQDLRSLVLGLERPETLHVQVSGETAVVTVPGGHTVKLKRDAGVWRVDDFD